MDINSALSAHENVVALVNEANGTSISPLHVTSEVTNDDVDGFGRNTQATLTAVVPQAPFRGSVVVNYRRLDLSNEVAPAPADLDFADGTTGEAILNEISTRMDLVQGEIEFVSGYEPVNMTDMLIRVCGKLNSRLYLRNHVELPISWVRPPLSSFITNLELNGYGDLTDQFDAALTHWAALVGSYANIVFVDGATGNDTAPTTGERTAPFATISYAETRATTNTAIIVANGTYTQNVENGVDAISGGGLRPGSKKLGYFCAPFGVLVECVAPARRDVHAFVSYNTATVAGGFILRLNTGARGDAVESYAVAFCAGDQGGVVAGQLYNCVLTSTGPAALSYSNNGATDLHINHCVLHAVGAAKVNYGSAPGKVVGCAAKTGFTLTAAINTPANMAGQKFDASWSTSNVSDSLSNDGTVGVYSGTYAWPGGNLP